MVKIICKITFADGAMLTGSIDGMRSTDDRYPVHYEGAIDRLPAKDRLPMTHGSTLKAVFTNLARAAKARLETSEIGSYDYGTQ